MNSALSVTGPPPSVSPPPQPDSNSRPVPAALSLKNSRLLIPLWPIPSLELISDHSLLLTAFRASRTAPTHRSPVAQVQPRVEPVYCRPLPVSRALRYSETTRSVSSSTEVSATGL